MARRLAVSEFPNDNPELHDGLVWACPAPCAPALPTLRLRESGPVRVLKPGWDPATPIPPAAAPAAFAPALEPELREVAPAAGAAFETPVSEVADAVAELASAEPEPVGGPDSEAKDGPSPSGFEAFVAALSAILAERGATRAAANVGALLGQTRLARDAFDAETKKVLAARGFVDTKTARPTPEFSVVAQAWREVLDGANGDLSACGSATLDVWGADIAAALLGSPRERTDDIRRALRQRGVAAFGMLAAA
jgi:hypothetical protein